MALAKLSNSVLTLKSATDKETNPVSFHVSGSDFIDQQICGVYGIITFDDIEYLILVVQSSEICHISSQPVYLINKIAVFAIGNHCDSFVLNLIYDFFNISGIYYSNYPLYLRASNLSAQSSEFLFNSIPLNNYRKYSNSFALCCIQGFVGSFSKLILISRRSYLRAGARFFMRGCDSDGNCSNFVETEQIIDGISTYLQIRGSIPIKWSHYIGLSYTPPLLIHTNSSDNFDRCSHKLKTIYNETIIYFNLIRPYGYEYNINNEFKKVLGTNQAVHIDFYDKMANNNLDLEFVPENDFTSLINKEVQQTVLIRTNCIDCLDRTNAAQYFIGSKVLDSQLRDSNLDFARYRDGFKYLFKMNGDALSRQNSGTKALSSHYYTGNVALFAKLTDGLNAIIRYYINRVSHSRIEIAYEIVTGARIKSTKLRRRLVILKSIILFILIYFIVNYNMIIEDGYAIIVILSILAKYKNLLIY